MTNNIQKQYSLLQKLGLLGIVSLLSYSAAVVFAPMAFPGYDWMAQAVSDLSAESAPSRMLWNQLSALYVPCGIVCCTAVSLSASENLGKPLRIGIYLFTWMNWVSAVGYAMFPLTGAVQPDGFQNVMHIAVTVLVVLLSVLSLAVIAVGAFKSRLRSLAVWAILALCLMMAGAIGTNVVPAQYFGIPERFSVFAATGFNALLGLYLFFGRFGRRECRK